MSYCIRNAAGEYLTHSVDVVKGTSALWFTPSPWMAYCTEEWILADTLARCEGGTVETWERPATSKRAR